MALDSTQFRVAPQGHVYVAPLGTAQPNDVTTAWAAGWTEVGYVDDSGVKVIPKLNTTDIASWQSATATKVIIQSTALTLQYNLQQSNAFNTQLYWFGSAWAALGGGVFKQTIAAAPATDERQFGVEWTDAASSITQRLVIPRGMVTDRSEMDLNRKGIQVWGMTFEALDAGNGVLGYMLSNDANE